MSDECCAIHGVTDVILWKLSHCFPIAFSLVFHWLLIGVLAVPFWQLSRWLESGVRQGKGRYEVDVTVAVRVFSLGVRVC